MMAFDVVSTFECHLLIFPKVIFPKFMCVQIVHMCVWERERAREKEHAQMLYGAWAQGLPTELCSQAFCILRQGLTKVSI